MLVVVALCRNVVVTNISTLTPNAMVEEKEISKDEVPGSFLKDYSNKNL